MAIKKFRSQDIITNTMRTHPSCEFFIADSQIYYNNAPYVSGTINLGGPVPVTSGYASLYEMNVDRLSGSTSRFIGGTAEPNEETLYTLIDSDSGVDPKWNAGEGAQPGTQKPREQYPYSQTAAAGLQGWWKMASAALGEVADATGNNNATCNDGIDCPGVTGPPPKGDGDDPNIKNLTGQAKVMQFDGEYDGLDIGRANTWDAIIGNDTGGGSTQKMTFAMWIKKTGDGGDSGYGRLIDFGYGDLRLYTSPTEHVILDVKWTDTGGSGTNGVAKWVSSAAAFSLRTWTHIALTYDASSTSNNPVLYINGESVSIPVSTAPAGNYYGIYWQDGYIGNTAAHTGDVNEATGPLTNGFEGEMTQFAIWNVILTADDVAALYNAGKYGSVFKTFGGFVPSQIVDNGLIYPFVTKDGNRLSLSSVTTGSTYDLDYQYGDVIVGSYPLSASITRELIGWYPTANGGTTGILNVIGPYGSDDSGGSRGAGQVDTGEVCLFPATEDNDCEDWADARVAEGDGGHQKCGDDKTWHYQPAEDRPGLGVLPQPIAMECNSPMWPHYWALKNTLNGSKYLSQHYGVTSSYGIKDQQIVNLISIPSTFYGSKIKPGTVSLKWYLTGTLIGELQDTKQNGELMEISTSNPYIEQYGAGNVAGVVMYKEGFILLTGSWALNETEGCQIDDGSPATRNYDGAQITIRSGSGNTPYAPMWIDWGAGANDNCNKLTTSTSGSAFGDPNVPMTIGTYNNFESAAFGLSFQGTSDTQVITMFANAFKGEANFSNNPTYLSHTASVTSSFTTSSYAYVENPNRLVYSFVSSSAADHSASFKREVYISRVGIYDENKNLIGVATLADPVRKAEDEDLTFKLKLDI